MSGAIMLTDASIFPGRGWPGRRPGAGDRSGASREANIQVGASASHLSRQTMNRPVRHVVRDEEHLPVTMAIRPTRLLR